MTVAFQDLFNGVDGTDLAAHTPDIGTGWSKVVDTGSTTQAIQLDGNGAAELSVTENNQRVIYTAETAAPLPAEYDITITIDNVSAGTNDKMQVFARFIDDNNWYCMDIGTPADSNNCRLAVKQNGSVTILQQVTNDPDIGDVYKLEIRNAVKRVLKNGVEILSSNDNSITSAGKAGFGYGNSVVSTDDAQTGPRIRDFLVETLDSAVTLTLNQVAWAASGLSVLVNARAFLSLANSSWQYVNQMLGINAISAISLLQTNWSWGSQATDINARLVQVLGQTLYSWAGVPLPVNADLLLLMQQVSWNIAAENILVNARNYFSFNVATWSAAGNALLSNARLAINLSQDTWEWAKQSLSVTGSLATVVSAVEWFWRGAQTSIFGLGFCADDRNMKSDHIACMTPDQAWDEEAHS